MFLFFNRKINSIFTSVLISTINFDSDEADTGSVGSSGNGSGTGPGPARFDGTASLLYWADVSAELAILVPSGPDNHQSRPASSLPPGNPSTCPLLSQAQVIFALSLYA